MDQIQYISDENNNITGVIVPIELWREIESEKETAYLLKSEKMKKRLLEAKDRKEGIPFDDACEKLPLKEHPAASAEQLHPPGDIPRPGEERSRS